LPIIFGTQCSLDQFHSIAICLTFISIPLSAAATKKKEKKKDKKKGGKKAAAFNSDDDADEPSLTLPPAPASDEEDDEEEAPVNLVASKKGGKKKKGGAASAFALLMADEDEDAALEEEDDVEEEVEEEEEPEEEEENSSSGKSLVIAEVMSVSPHPKADRLRVCQIDAGSMGTVPVVTNAVEVVEGMLVVLAPVGCVTPGSGIKIEKALLRGVDSHGMLCSAYDIGWTEEADGVLVQMPEGDFEPGDECPEDPPAGAVWGKPTKKEKKSSKKKAASAASAFAALGLDDEEGEDAAAEDDEEDAAPVKEKKKKKKSSKALDSDSLFAALAMDEDAAEGGESTAADAIELDLSGAKKKSKKKKSAAADIDLDALLAGESVETAASAVVSSKEDKKKKKGKKSAPADEDLDALLAEIDGPKAPAPAPAAAGGGKKDKKKGKGGAAKGEEEDLDAILAELGMKPEETPAAAPAAAAEAPAAAAEEEEEEGEEGEGGEKEMSAAAKKKAKKKAKEKAKKAGEGGGAEEEAADVAAGGAGKKAPKVSAAVRRMQEALEAKRIADEEAARLAEETRIREEEEERLREEEETRKKEEAEKRKADKAARREQLKKEGKLLTGKAKAEAERLARVREQLLRQAGIDPTEIAPKKKPVYTKKKSQPKKKSEDAETEAPVEEKPAESAVAEAAVVEPEAPAEPESWEDAADDWEAMDEDSIQLPKTEEEEDAELKKAAAAAAAKKAAAAAAADTNGKKKPAASSSDSGSESGSGSDDEDESGSSESGSGSESDSDSDSESDYSSSYDSDSSDSGDEMGDRIAAARERREARLQEALANRDPSDLRSPICCILGHVDTGKTKILDNIRRTNVQDGEAGGITQQIGATYIPGEALVTRTEELRKGRQFDLKLPGLLVIDTPGHESFSNLRSRGSGLCDIAVLVVDLMHGLEQQTIESINLLRMRKTPFIIAMNKVDRLFQWNSVANSPIQDALARQEETTMKEFEHRYNQVALQLNEQGLNVALYWKNKDPKSFVNIVPTSAITGEGIPDLLQLLVKLTQSLMVERLMFVPELQCTVLEVKQIEGLGTTIDVVLVNGMLKEGDTIVVCGLSGPIVTTIRALLTPQPMREIRVKGQYIHHKELRAAMGVKIAAHNLENAVAGTQLLIVNPGDDVEALKAEVMEDMQDIFSGVDKTGEGVAVQASTLGSLEALLEFLRSPDVQIPVSSINIGPVHKRDIMRASVMIERGAKKYGVILAFDVPVNKEAREQAEDLGVKIFTADIIYHLFDQFTAYLKQVREEEQEAAKLEAVFPCVLRILPDCVYNKKDPILVGVEVVEGIAKVGTPLCVPSQGRIDLGRIAGLEKDHKSVQKAMPGDKVAMKIESTKPEEAARLYGRHFDHTDALVSKITRKSINVLKDMFRDEMGKDDWKLIIRLKKMFNIE
jgi:translation initiation factor 5B